MGVECLYRGDGETVAYTERYRPFTKNDQALPESRKWSERDLPVSVRGHTLFVSRNVTCPMFIVFTSESSCYLIYSLMIC